LNEQRSVRFRLWAPDAQQVELCLGVGDERLPMTREHQGWYAATASAAPGTHYRYRINGDIAVPDPASRFQPEDVHGPSEVIDPAAFVWSDANWRGRPWEEVVFYELHVGSFTRAGTYAGVEARLQHLRDLGVTAIELMPLADFPGRRNWGYDGVLLFAPDSQYGRPEDLKRLIDSAHRLGLMVFLDVVYNHFGPEGNYLGLYASAFLSDRHQTPWGAAINFDGPDSRPVRDYYIHNALYWLEEYHFDGLRLDAVHAIVDDSVPDILTELAQTVAAGPGARRQVHLVLENDGNEARYLQPRLTGQPRLYRAQWNDDIHHALHVIGTGETAGYYVDYADAPRRHLGRALIEGFAYQGEASPLRNGAARGEPSLGIPLSAFVSFLQNHDQIGNRALGERITQIADPVHVRAISAIFLLAPGPPLLFMGQEWGALTPFLFFCDFAPDLARAVTEGRRKEFSRFPEFSDPDARARIPDPSDPATFARSRLDWDELAGPGARDWLAWHREVLAVRAREIVPRLDKFTSGSGWYELLGGQGLYGEWALSDGARLLLYANLSDHPLDRIETPAGRRLYRYAANNLKPLTEARLAPWSVVWFLKEAGAA
jgi:malto-oligosyltrehalose trehalohydrolase